MDYVYLLVVDGAEWEDIIVFLSEEEAIEKSKKYPKARLELFAKSEKGYKPTYKYYQNGVLVQNS
jgi:hypothetical protein